MSSHGSFIWSIETWESGLKLGRGRAIVSDLFSFKEDTANCTKIHSWKLLLYPKGKFCSPDKETAIDLLYCGAGSIEIEVEISLLNPKNEKVLTKKSNVCISDSASFPYLFYSDPHSRHIDEAVEELLNEKRIVLLCRIKILKKNCIVVKPKVKRMRLETSQSLNVTVGEDQFEKLLVEKKFSDVAFKVSGKEVYLHKFMLVSKSPVFAAMFEHEMQENQQSVVDVADIEYNVFKEMLRFVYTGNVNELGSIASDLLVAADKYCLEDLKAECEKVLSVNITLDNVVACLDLAIRCNTSVLKHNVFQFIACNKKLVINSEEFKLLAKKDSGLSLEVCLALANYQ